MLRWVEQNDATVQLPVCPTGLALLAFCALLAGSANAVQSETKPVQTTFSAEAGSVRLVASISKTKAAVADPVELELTVTAPEGVRVFLPRVPDRLGTLEVVDQKQWPDIPTGEGRQWRLRLVIESIQSGEWKIPAIEIGLAGNGEHDRIRSPEIPLTITSVLEDRADPTAFRDIRNVVDLPVPAEVSYAWVGWTAGALAGFCGLIALVVAVTRRRRWMSPGQWAIRELATVRQGLESGTVRGADGASALAMTLKTFLEMHFGFAATTCTTDQLLAALGERTGTNPEIIGDLAKQLRRLDLISYAGLESGSRELVEFAEQTTELVRQMDAVEFVRDHTTNRGGGA